MTARRSLSETLTELAEGAMLATAGAGVRATRVEIALPVEIALLAADGELVAELPRFIRRTAFDPPISRLSFVWEAAG